MVLKCKKLSIDRRMDMKGDLVTGLFSIDLLVHCGTILENKALQKYILSPGGDHYKNIMKTGDTLMRAAFVV